MTTRYQKAKAWASKHSEEIMMLTVFVATAAVAAYIGKLSFDQIAEANAEVEANRQKIQDAVNRGCSVLPNPDGSYWIIEPRTA